MWDEDIWRGTWYSSTTHLKKRLEAIASRSYRLEQLEL